jgi:hypothetical protein
MAASFITRASLPNGTAREFCARSIACPSSSQLGSSLRPANSSAPESHDGSSFQAPRGLMSAHRVSRESASPRQRQPHLAPARIPCARCRSAGPGASRSAALRAPAAGEWGPAGEVRRALVVLWTADAVPASEIASRLHLRAEAVSRIRRRFLDGGTDGLADRPKTGRKDHALPAQTIEKIVHRRGVSAMTRGDGCEVLAGGRGERLVAARRCLASERSPMDDCGAWRRRVAGVEDDAVGRDVGARALAALERVDQEQLPDTRTLAGLVHRRERAAGSA